MTFATWHVDNSKQVHVQDGRPYSFGRVCPVDQSCLRVFGFLQEIEME
jgi:hypothetical protein